MSTLNLEVATDDFGLVGLELRTRSQAQLRSCSDRAAVGDPSLAARSLQAVQALQGSIMVNHGT